MKHLKTYKLFELVDNESLLEIVDVIKDFAEDNNINISPSLFEIYRETPNTIWYLDSNEYSKIGVFKFYYILEPFFSPSILFGSMSKDPLLKITNLKRFEKLLEDNLMKRISDMGYKVAKEREVVIRGDMYRKVVFTINIDEEINFSF